MRHHRNRANNAINFMERLDFGQISPLTAKIFIKRLYEKCPSAFDDFKNIQNNNYMHLISEELKKMNNGMVFYIMSCVLNISINKCNEMISILNIEWNNKPLIEYSSFAKYIF